MFCAWQFINLSIIVSFSRAFNVVPTEQAFTLHRADDGSHEFWGQERSKDEVEMHVNACLSKVQTLDAIPKVEVLSAEPPLVVIHSFLSTSMCDEIIQSALDSDTGMRRSTVGASQNTSETRTSSTVWLREQECQHPLRLIAEQISSISGLPTNHMENLQVVRYNENQRFDLHTDHRPSFNDLECRGRLATCLIYLAEPENGGETFFPGLFEEVKVPPRQGSAVFFWNTVQRPGSEGYHPKMFLDADIRLRHAGLPVLSGEKWVCNRWIHPIDFGAGVRGI